MMAVAGGGGRCGGDEGAREVVQLKLPQLEARPPQSKLDESSHN